MKTFTNTDYDRLMRAAQDHRATTKEQEFLINMHIEDSVFDRGHK